MSILSSDLKKHINIKDIEAALTKVTEGQGVGVKDEASIRQIISESGLIEKFADQVRSKVRDTPEIIKKPSAVAPTATARLGQRSIQLGIIKGRALVGLNSMDSDPSACVQVHVQFENARFSTKRVMSQVEPVFEEFVEFDLPKRDINLLVDFEYPIHIVLTQQNMHGQIAVIGVAKFDWRRVLSAGRISTLVELRDQNHPMIVGVLDIVLEFLPFDGGRARKDELEYHIKRQNLKKAELETAFYLNAKQWWSDFLQIRQTHASRLVKIFSSDEFGNRKTVCSFLQPVSCLWLETPRHAARFVSLIEYSPSKRVGDSSSLEIWQSLHSFLSSEKGDIQDLAILLCCLLLGFHLDAYVTLGTDSSSNAHIWVTTIDAAGQPRFWEPLTGMHFGQSEAHHFGTVGSCFNQKNLFANIQLTDGADRVKFKFTDSSCWKKLEPDCSSPVPFKLLKPISIDVKVTEFEIEQVLKQCVEFFRRDHHLSCLWDEELSSLLGQNLWSMEHGKISGSSAILYTDDFQMGVKRSIPEGHTFRGFPIPFNHTHPQRMMQKIMKSKQCRNVLVSRGDEIRMAIKAKIFLYTENVLVCWFSNLMWKKHPNPNSSNKQKSITTASKLPIRSFASEEKELMYGKSHDKSTSKTQERAKNIVLSSMNVVNTGGKLRVARNHGNLGLVAANPLMPTVSKIIMQDKENIDGEIINQDNQKNSIIEPHNLVPQIQDHSIFTFQTALQRTTYEFKAPAAARYFLWDNERIGSTMFLKPAEMTFEAVQISGPALKAMRVEFLKLSLLYRSNSTVEIPAIAGFLFGRVDFSTNGKILEFDRFKSGSVPTGIMRGDFVIHVVWNEATAKRSFNYITLLESFDKALNGFPLDNLTNAFPLFAHFQHQDKDIQSPKFRMILPNLELEIYPISAIRLVNTTLSHRLVTEIKIAGSEEYGLMSIDQARQLYLIPHDSSVALSIPLIGVWIKSDANNLMKKKELFQKCCMRYISNKKVSKLDTGKDNMLIYFFSNESPSRPDCFECSFRKSGEPYILFGTIDSIPFEEMGSDEDGLAFALNQVMDIPLKTKEEPIEVKPSSIKDEDCLPMIMSSGAHLPAIAEDPSESHTPDNENPVETTIMETPIIKEQNSISPPLIEQAVGEENSYPNADSTREQPQFVPPMHSIADSHMMYINFLQQQIVALQSQMLSLHASNQHVSAYPVLAPQETEEAVAIAPESLKPVVKFAPTAPFLEKPYMAAVEKQVLESATSTSDLCQETGYNQNMQDEGIQVSVIMQRNFESIGTNTSFLYPAQQRIEPTSNAAPVPPQAHISTTTASEFEEVIKINNSFPPHAPTDNGSDYQVFFKSLSKTLKDDDPNPISTDQNDADSGEGRDIIAALVENAEESFYHSQSECDSGTSVPYAPIFKKSKPKLKPVVNRPSFSHVFMRKNSFVNNDSRDSSIRMDQISEGDDLSLSFATMKYLEKYDLL